MLGLLWSRVCALQLRVSSGAYNNFLQSNPFAPHAEFRIILFLSSRSGAQHALPLLPHHFLSTQIIDPYRSAIQEGPDETDHTCRQTWKTSSEPDRRSLIRPALQNLFLEGFHHDAPEPLGSIVDKCFLVAIYYIYVWLHPLSNCRPT
jgi:hypothetical protein